MSSNTRGTFPEKIEDNYNYIDRVVTYLNTAAVLARLGVTGSNMGILNKLFTNPTPVAPQSAPNDLGLKELWALHNNPATKGPGITKLLDARFRKHLETDPIGIENQLRVIYNDIAASALTDTDRTTLHLPLRSTTHTTHKVATKNTVLWNSVGIKGGDVHTKCFPSGASILNPSAATQRGTGTKGTRPHKEKGYNIRTLATIVKQGIAIPTLANLPDPNQPLPAGWILLIDTKASIVHHFGAANVGNVLVEFKQWHNSIHPDLDGPWSGPETTIIT